MAPKTSIGEVKEKHALNLLGIEGVEGVGIGEEGSHPAIKVYVSRDPRSLESKIPGEIDGYPVSLEYPGEFNAFE